MASPPVVSRTDGPSRSPSYSPSLASRSPSISRQETEQEQQEPQRSEARRSRSRSGSASRRRSRSWSRSPGPASPARRLGMDKEDGDGSGSGDDDDDDGRPRRSASPRAARVRAWGHDRYGDRDRASFESVEIRGLPKMVYARHLAHIFGAYGTVVDVIVPTFARSGENRGHAYVVYRTVQNAADAVEHMHGGQIDGAVIHVSQRPVPQADRTRRGAAAGIGTGAGPRRRSDRDGPRDAHDYGYEPRGSRDPYGRLTGPPPPRRYGDARNDDNDWVRHAQQYHQKRGGYRNGDSYRDQRPTEPLRSAVPEQDDNVRMHPSHRRAPRSRSRSRSHSPSHNHYGSASPVRARRRGISRSQSPEQSLSAFSDS